MYMIVRSYHLRGQDLIKIITNIMISHVIKLRTDCNLKKLKLYLSRFFDRQKHDCRYIFIQLKLQTVSENILKIGDSILLDIKKVKNVNGYKDHIDIYSTKYFSNSNDDKVNKIIIEYIELSRKEYMNQLRNINLK